MFCAWLKLPAFFPICFGIIFASHQGMRWIGFLALITLLACEEDPVGTQFQVFNNTGAVIEFSGLGQLLAVGQSFSYEQPCDLAECGYPEAQCSTVPFSGSILALNDGESMTFDWDGTKWELDDQANCALPAQPTGLLQWSFEFKVGDKQYQAKVPFAYGNKFITLHLEPSDLQ